MVSWRGFAGTGVRRAPRAPAPSGAHQGRPPGFDRAAYKRRNEVERTILELKGSRAVATKHDKRVYVFHGTVISAAIRLWLRA